MTDGQHRQKGEIIKTLDTEGGRSDGTDEVPKK